MTIRPAVCEECGGRRMPDCAHDLVEEAVPEPRPFWFGSLPITDALNALLAERSGQLRLW